MGIEEKIGEESKTWRMVQLGFFDGLYKKAREMGYNVIGLTPRGLRLHIISSPNWATITEIDSREIDHKKNWELVTYNYYPNSDEPRFDKKK